jgi:succinoglycan biosynthesis protein ExoA
MSNLRGNGERPIVDDVAAQERRVLVVIPTLNEADHIEELVLALLRDTPPGRRSQIVVADGGSTDGTIEIVSRLAKAHPSVQYVSNPARFQAAGINLAVKRFGDCADVLVRCDAHARYPGQYCERLLRSLEQSGADSVVVVLESKGRTPLQQAVAWVSNSAIGTGGSAHRNGKRSGFVDHGHHAAFKLHTFRRLGGYEETFTHNEDAELDCRQRALGAQIYLDAGIRVTYYPRSTWGGLATQYFRYGHGRARTIRRHPTSIRLRQILLPVHYCVCTMAVGLSPWCPALLAWPALYVTVLAGASLVFCVRQRSIKGLLCGPAASVMHASWASGFLYGLLRSGERVWRQNTTRADCATLELGIGR